MKKDILFLSLSEFFTVYSKLCLQDMAVCRHLNLRYPNEDYSLLDHDLEQIRNIQYEHFQMRGLAPRALPFSFDAHLAGRIERQLKKQQPSLIFIEFHALGEMEFKLLNLVQRLSDSLPIVVIIPESEKTTNKTYQLLTHGVKEILTDYDAEILRNSFLLHVNPLS